MVDFRVGETTSDVATELNRDVIKALEALLYCSFKILFPVLLALHIDSECLYFK